MKKKSGQCPECTHPTDEHDQWAGCRHKKAAASGKQIVCGCTRVIRKGQLV